MLIKLFYKDTENPNSIYNRANRNNSDKNTGNKKIY